MESAGAAWASQNLYGPAMQLCRKGQGPFLLDRTSDGSTVRVGILESDAQVPDHLHLLLALGNCLSGVILRLDGSKIQLTLLGNGAGNGAGAWCGHNW